MKEHLPDGFFVNTFTGTFVATAYEEDIARAPYTLVLDLLDCAQAVATVGIIYMPIVAKPTFQLVVKSPASRVSTIFSSSDEGVVDPTTKPDFLVDQSYIILPLQLDPIRTHVSAGKFEHITFSLKKHASALSGFFINPNTGEIQGKIRRDDLQAEPHLMYLIATDLGGETHTVEPISVKVREHQCGDRRMPEGMKYNTTANTSTVCGDPRSCDTLCFVDTKSTESKANNSADHAVPIGLALSR
jgi:hypothetical protein